MSIEVQRAYPAFGKEVGGRPVTQVWGRRAMVSSMHPDATLAGLDILRAGGNAVDAAIAVGAAMAVTNHNWTGLAGDSAWLIYNRDKDALFQLDAYTVCPRGLTAELLAQRFGLDIAIMPEAFAEEPAKMRETGVITAMVPGTPSGLLTAWKRFGSLPFAKLFERAIDLAHSGIVISDYVAGSLLKEKSKLDRFSTSRAIFFDAQGEPLRNGDTLRQADLAATLERYAADPEHEFVSGSTAEAIAACARASKAPMNLIDLAEYTARWRQPVEGSYRGHRIGVAAPPTAGLHVLQALNILEHFDLSRLSFHGVGSLHLVIEAVKQALSDRRQWGGDPDRMTIPVERLVDKEASAAFAAKVKHEVASLPGSGSIAGETAHFVVMDEAGNVVTATQSIGNDFGCGEVAEGTGLVMNDRSWWMSLGSGPNRVFPGQRANIGHAPAIVFADGKPWIALGSPGGFGIVPYVVQTLVSMIDYGFDVQSAIEAARFRIMDLASTVAFESRVDPAVLAALRELGHDTQLFAAWTDRVGGVEAIERDRRTGNLLGGYDPRRNSYAAGY